MKAKKIVSILAVFCIVLLGGICLTACGGGGNNKLTISFDSNGGTNVAAIEYVDGELTMPSDPTREDYLFGGWFEDNGTWDAEFDASKASDYVAKKNITLYAKWLKKVILVFVVNTEQIEDVYLDSLDIELPTPQKPYNSDDSLTFAGWYLDSNLEKPYTTRTVVKPNDYNEVFLYPKWESNKPRSIYYFADGIDLPKTSDIVEPTKRVTLYQPEIKFWEFCGWFYDREFTKQAPLRLSFEMISQNGLVLYGKFVQKEIDYISLVGKIKTHYEYGESIDLGDAKILVKYKDPKYENEIIDITSDMISGFSTVDTGQYAYIPQNSNEQDYDFCGLVSFQLDITKFQHNNSSIPPILDSSNFYYTDSICYYVNTDLETLSLSEESLTFNFGDSIYLSSKNLSVNWTDKNGESGTEKLLDVESFSSSNNYNISNLSTNSLGSSTFKLRYHFKTIEVNYTVNPIEVESGYIDETRNAIILNSQKSLLDGDVQIYLHTPNNNDILYRGLKLEDIVVDIDTKTSGEHKAKIKFNGQDIEISYTVIDLDKIESAEIKDQFYTTSYLLSYATVTFAMEDGSTFDFKIDRNPIYPLGGKPNAYFIGTFDLSTAGTKYIKTYFYGKEIDVKYIVKDAQYSYGRIVGHI